MSEKRLARSRYNVLQVHQQSKPSRNFSTYITAGILGEVLGSAIAVYSYINAKVDWFGKIELGGGFYFGMVIAVIGVIAMIWGLYLLLASIAYHHEFVEMDRLYAAELEAVRAESRDSKSSQ